MKVLQVYKDYWPVVGGIENHIRRLAVGLSSLPDVDVEILVTSRDRKTRHETTDGVNVTKAGRLGTFASAPISLDLFREISRSQFDIAHLHFPYPIGELAQLFRGRSRRLVVTYHSDIVRQKSLAKVYRPFLELLLHRADAICVSNAAYAESSPFLKKHREKIHVIHHGLDVRRFEINSAIQQQADTLQSEMGRSFVLFVGELRYYKGVDVLLSAMTRLEARLLVVGKGPEEDRLRRLSQDLELGDKVAFAGRLSDDQLAAAYHAAGVFVLPSTLRAESWGAVLLEAMACGLPLITTELGTGTSFINVDGVTGKVVPANDPGALADAIGAVLADEDLRKRLGDAGRKRLVEAFSAEKMIAETYSLYNDLLTHARI